MSALGDSGSSGQYYLKVRFRVESGHKISQESQFLMTGFGRGCVKTQKRPPETDSKLGEFSVEVSCLLTARYRRVSQSVASHVVFEGDLWGETVVEF